jgi:hypothetical protein
MTTGEGLQKTVLYIQAFQGIHSNLVQVWSGFQAIIGNSLTLREGNSLRVSDNRALRRIFGPKGEEVAGGWRRLQNEELHNLYASSNIIRMIKSRRVI